MSYSSEDETDISDSELDEYVDRCYEQIRNGNPKVKFSDEIYRCPYCPGKKKRVYIYKDLLQHATDVGKGSQNRDIKHKGKHLGLVKFMKDDLEQEEVDISSELSRLNLDLSPKYGLNELFVWPWMGILANVDVESCSKLKIDLTQRGGFDLLRIRPLSSGRYAVVEFKKDWSGFYNAIMFEKEFEVYNSEKKDYRATYDQADNLHGWVARKDDYDSEGILGDYLKKNGDLKTLGDVEAEEKRKNGLLIANLNKTIQELRMHLDELESNHRETPAVTIQNDEVH